MRRLALAPLTLLLAFCLSGCTAIGATIGSSIDNNRREYGGAEQIVRLKPGQTVHFELTDGSKFAATVRRVVPAETVNGVESPARLVVKRNDTITEEDVRADHIRRIGVNRGVSYGNVGMMVGIAGDAAILLLTVAAED